ncbi:tyrosine decarboxylase / aspartate 1-decarboxylase [Halogeometricum rufum]|uniref:Probable L-aspartate decarboxylase n=2 Tax=Halogeometricum TaxID=60846 RepID=A0A1I6GFB1_9EURY|nr:tyrosine decarboxylase MfnA [Halogeometricum rufum]SFR40882.1 tyrosine decarboxylase / aspartate 1-decarboxylase [Halogeometricum rufum]
MQRSVPQTFDRVLSSMCTDPHPAARAAAERFLATNPGDPATYRDVAELEADAVATLGEMTGLADPHGYVTSGGTEANVQAVRAARNRRRGDVSDPNVVAPESAHFSFNKAADVLDVELRLVPTDDDHRADVGAVRAAVDDDTVLVVGVAGTTEFGRVDPIPELAAVAHDAGAFLHVDAAWGGFLLPFTDRAWSFAHAPVDSLTVDPHKCGQACIPAGGLLFRDRSGLDSLAVETPYLESTSQATLTGTRSGAGVASAAAAMDELWPDGYRREYERAADLASWFAGELRSRGFDVVDPELPLVAADVSDSLFAALRDREWRVSRTDAGHLRVVCMPHVTREALSSFLADVDAVR